MGDAMMVRVSECRYWIATVFESRICVAQTKTMIEVHSEKIFFCEGERGFFILLADFLRVL